MRRRINLSRLFEFDPKMDRQELGLFLLREAKKEQIAKACPPEKACAVARAKGTVAKSLIVTANMDLKAVLVKYRELFG